MIVALNVIRLYSINYIYLKLLLAIRHEGKKWGTILEERGKLTEMASLQ